MNVGGDKWDLKSRQKFEMFENQFLYDEENDIDDETIEEDDDLEEDDIDEEYEEEYDDGDDDLS
mgnify:FL=1